MKEKITISVDSETLESIDKHVKSGTYRNRSHAFENSVKNIWGKNSKNRLKDYSGIIRVQN